MRSNSNVLDNPYRDNNAKERKYCLCDGQRWWQSQQACRVWHINSIDQNSNLADSLLQNCRKAFLDEIFKDK